MDPEENAEAEREHRHSPEPVEKTPEEMQCPECGIEEGIVVIEHPQIPAEQSARCPKCEHVDHPVSFHGRWEWERMDESEREEQRAMAERYEAEMAEAQHSAAYIANQREP